MGVYEELILNYRFQVLIENKTLSFARISGLGMERETEILAEGGNSGGGRLLAVPLKNSRTLRMERGVCTRDSTLISKLRPGICLPQGIIVVVMGSDGKPAIQYVTEQAFVTRWEIADLEADQGKVLINTFEISYIKLDLMKSAYSLNALQQISSL